MYEIIDESLKLASCGINDLTLEQASSFLSQWEDGAKLGTLTLFFNPETGYLVLNKDHPQYEFNLELAEAYLSASGIELEEYRKRFSGSRLEKTLYVMDNFREYSRIQNDLSVIRHQVTFPGHITEIVLRSLERTQMPTCFLMSQAYSYGVMNGKRMERARRKAVAV